MHFLSFIKVGTVVLIALVTLFSKLFFSRKKNSNQQEDFTSFEKNENGLYPWEVNRDDSPKSIPKEATRFVEKEKNRRGKW